MSDHTIIVIWIIKIFFCILLLCILLVFLLFSASVRSMPFCPLLCPSLCEIFPWYLNSPEEISSLSHSTVFLCFFALIPEQGFLISTCYFLEPCIQMVISFPFSFAFTSLLFSAICKASSDNHFILCISFFGGWSWSLSPVQCHKPPFTVLQALVYQI